MLIESERANESELERIYERRFDGRLAYRNRVWKTLTERFWSRFVPADAAVLDLGCGYGEFINNISSGAKFAMDMNPATRMHLQPDVTFLQQDCSKRWPLEDSCLDAVFSSNFFEHLPSKTALADTIDQAVRCLKTGGSLIAMGPNVRYVPGAYWDFWDHHIALTERSLGELLETRGFRVELSVDRFLPYTMVERREAPLLFVELYLKFPMLWKIYGKQFLIVARVQEKTLS